MTKRRQRRRSERDTHSHRRSNTQHHRNEIDIRVIFTASASRRAMVTLRQNISHRVGPGVAFRRLICYATCRRDWCQQDLTSDAAFTTAHQEFDMTHTEEQAVSPLIAGVL